MSNAPATVTTPAAAFEALKITAAELAADLYRAGRFVSPADAADYAIRALVERMAAERPDLLAKVRVALAA